MLNSRRRDDAAVLCAALSLIVLSARVPRINRLVASVTEIVSLRLLESISVGSDLIRSPGCVCLSVCVCVFCVCVCARALPVAPLALPPVAPLAAGAFAHASGGANISHEALRVAPLAAQMRTPRYPWCPLATGMRAHSSGRALMSRNEALRVAPLAARTRALDLTGGASGSENYHERCVMVCTAINLY